MSSLPVELARAIAKQTEKLNPGELARAAEGLSHRYRAQAGCSKALSSELERTAYLVTRMPATFAACSAVLRELRSRVPNVSFASMLDLGAGPGTAAWVALEIFPDLQHIELVEREPGMVALGQQLAASGRPALAQATWIHADVNQHSTAELFDLVTLAYSLGEIGERDRATVMERAWQRTKIALVVVEPGTPRGYDVVIEARQQLIADGAKLLAPCPHEGQCPMAGTKDWCHFAERLERSAAHRKLKSGSLGYEDEKFSYVIFTRPPAERAEARIVRHPVHGKGHIKLELCAQDGLKQITVTRSQGEAFRRARKARWGDEWRLDVEQC